MKKYIITASISVLILIAVILLSCFNKTKTEYMLSDMNEKEILKDYQSLYGQNVSINTRYGEGAVTGEIIIGGTLAGAHGSAYDNGPYTNGYCFYKGGTLYGTYVSGHKLNTTQSAFTGTNVSSDKQAKIEWLLENILRMNLTNATISAEETDYYKNNLIHIMNINGIVDAAGTMASLSDKDIFVVQQYVFWHYTNNLNPSLTGSKEKLYNALVIEADKQTTYNSNGNEKPTVTKPENCTMIQDGSDVLIGPINISNPIGKNYRFTYGDFVIDGNTTVVGENVKAYAADKTTELVNNSFFNLYLYLLNISFC